MPSELIPIMFFFSVAAVLILRPLTKRLGLLLEAIARDRSTSQADDAELARVRVLIEHLSKRLELMEDRVDFTERLVGSTSQARSMAHLQGPTLAQYSPGSTSGSAR